MSTEEIVDTLNEFVDNSEREYLETANKIISGLTRYGVREVVAPAKSVRYHWSNGNAHWWMYGEPIKKGETVFLDANEFIMPYIKVSFCRKIAEKFNTLPLYKNSFEYDKLGERRAN